MCIYKLYQPKENGACFHYMRLGDNKLSFISFHCPYSFLLLIELKYNFFMTVGALFLTVNNIQFAAALHNYTANQSHFSDHINLLDY